MLWIFLTAAAAPLQVARNTLQRGLITEAGPWGATLVRFLFGLPFSLLILAGVALATPDAQPHVSARFLIAVSIGAAGQVGATAALLVAMRGAGVAVATFMQQASLPLGALAGWILFGDHLSLSGWIGLALACFGLGVISWPSRNDLTQARGAILMGLVSGACFAVTLNAYRQAGLALEPNAPIFSAAGAVVVAQTLQTLGLGGYLALRRPQALAAIRTAWRSSLGAGFCGAAASACWFSALALAPAGPVRAVGVIEAPIAALVGRRLFRERLTLRQTVGGFLTAVGVVLTALGG